MVEVGLVLVPALVLVLEPGLVLVAVLGPDIP